MYIVIHPTHSFCRFVSISMVFLNKYLLSSPDLKVYMYLCCAASLQHKNRGLNRPFCNGGGGGVKVGTKWKIYMETYMHVLVL